MKQQDSLGTLQQASVEKMNSFQQALAAVNSAAESLRNSCNESSSSFRHAMEAAAKKWQSESEAIIKRERDSVQEAREAMIKERMADREEMVNLRRKLWMWGVAWVLGLSLMAAFTTICLLWTLPYRAFPSVIHARAEELVTLEAKTRERTQQADLQQNRLDRMTTDEQGLAYVKPRLGYPAKDPAAIWVRLPNGYRTIPGADGETWAQLR